jgi:hypothetical protein
MQYPSALLGESATRNFSTGTIGDKWQWCSRHQKPVTLGTAIAGTDWLGTAGCLPADWHPLEWRPQLAPALGPFPFDPIVHASIEATSSGRLLIRKRMQSARLASFAIPTEPRPSMVSA